MSFQIPEDNCFVCSKNICFCKGDCNCTLQKLCRCKQKDFYDFIHSKAHVPASAPAPAPAPAPAFFTSKNVIPGAPGVPGVPVFSGAPSATFDAKPFSSQALAQVPAQALACLQTTATVVYPSPTYANPASAFARAPTFEQVCAHVFSATASPIEDAFVKAFAPSPASAFQAYASSVGSKSGAGAGAYAPAHAFVATPSFYTLHSKRKEGKNDEKVVMTEAWWGGKRKGCKRKSDTSC